MYRNPSLNSTRDRDILALASKLGVDVIGDSRGYSARGTDGYTAGRAFDAAGGSGFAFLQSQLEQIIPDLVEPLSAVTHPRDLKVEVGGGFPEFISGFAANYGTTGNKFYGLQGTNNTDIAETQADIQKAIWKTFNWAAGMTITWLDLKRMEVANRTGTSPPFSLQELYKKSCTVNWNKALDYVAYLGFLGQPGLVNNPNVPEFVLPNGATGHTTWVTKTAPEILNDVNLMLNTVASNIGYAVEQGMPNHLLIPYNQYGYITNPFTLSGVGNGFNSIKDYVEKMCVATAEGGTFKIDRLPNPWISGQGSGGLDRAVCYRNDEEDVLLKVPQPMIQGMTVPTTRAGGSYETIYYGCVSQVIWKRTITAVYADGL